MKIRTGFISNSSSSSFLCKGYIINNNAGNIFDLYCSLDITSEKEFLKYINKNYPGKEIKENEIDEYKEEFIYDWARYNNDIRILRNGEDGLPEHLENSKAIVGIRKDIDNYRDVFITEEDEELLSKIKLLLPEESEQIIFAGTRSC